ncbi:ATP-binding protein [Streptomyces natalensis]|uniref:Biotin transporter BioY n=1 Tax=Streptomyces natalensis ATCC 27448 TaxID=1240678 RepID=A0A0D7CFU6_9ACTN|nr:ATP-binding protein [Streptomyces natalensis]KIZ14916.1 biotin transporter BioY [Streptomyces natalensis ATCC 27448]
MNTYSARPAVTELRLSAFKIHRGVTLPIGPLTLLAGESGSGKTSALQAYEILSRLGSGEPLAHAVGKVAGGSEACIPAGARADEQGRRGFRIGCTVDGPVGLVHLDLAVQAEPELRIVGERLTGGGETLLTTALTDPARRAVQAAWHTAGATPVTRAPLPDDRLATSLLPLRVAGKTAGQRLVLAAAEQVVVALRSVFACDPRPEVMRAAGRGAAPGPEATETAKAAKSARTAKAAKAAGAATRGRSTVRPGEAGGWRRDEEADEGRLRSSCENLPAVLERTSRECTRRHALLVAAVREACAGPVDGLHAVPREVKPAEEAVAAGVGPGVGAERAEPGATAGAWGDGGAGQGCVATRTVRGAVGVSPTSAGMQAVVDRGALGMMPVEQLGDGELRFLALALVLLTGPGVLEMDPAGEIPSACQQLTVMADGLDRCLDRRQARELLSLAVRMAERGHVRLLGSVRDPSAAEGLPGVQVLHLGA